MKPKRFTLQQALLDPGNVEKSKTEHIQAVDVTDNSKPIPVQDLMPLIESMNNTLTSIDTTLKTLVSMLEVVTAEYKARDCSGFLKRL